MTLREQQEIFIQNFAKLIAYIFDQGYTCTAGEIFRTEEQAKWNAEHGVGIINSLHRERLAGDLNLFKHGQYAMHTKDYQPFGEYWERLHPANRWGGRYEDGNHFEMRRVYE